MLYLQIRKAKPIKFYCQDKLILTVKLNEFGPDKKWAQFIVEPTKFDSCSMTLLEGKNKNLTVISDCLPSKSETIIFRYCHPIRDGRGAELKFGIEADENIKIEYNNKRKD